jgi:cytochrome bd-type quinol oxidase subunit 2
MNSKANSKHLTKLLIAEFAYCFLLFLIFTFAKKNASISVKVYLAITFLFLLVVIPFVFNAINYFRKRKTGEHGKASNYIITQIILVMLTAFQVI